MPNTLAKVVLPALHEQAGVEPQKAAFVLMSILAGLSSLALNGDMWALAYMSAERQCELAGVTPEEFERVRKQFNDFRVARKRRSPFAGMHEPE